MRAADRKQAYRSSWASDNGTSLLEVLLALAAGFIVLGAMLQSLAFFHGQYSRQQTAISHAQDVRIGLELLQQELRLVEPGALSIIRQDEIEFSANVHGYVTRLAAEAGTGQTILSVENGSGWPGRKTILLCWNRQCETGTLARDGQREALTITQPLSHAIPAGASVSILNRVRYYSRQDERGVPRFLRQIDGGAGVLVGEIREVRFSYWDDRGRLAASPAQVRRIVVELTMPQDPRKAIREIGLRA